MILHDTERESIIAIRSSALRISLLFFILLASIPCPGWDQEENVVVFLNGNNADHLKLSFHLDAVSLIDEEGKAHALAILEDEVESGEEERFQIRLISGMVRERAYGSLRMNISSPSVGRKKASLLWSGEPITIPVNVLVSKGRIEVLFLKWDVPSSVTRKIEFKPGFVVSKPEPIVRSLKIFATDEGLGEVLVIDRHKDRVASIIKVEKEPKGLVLSPDAERLYVANAGSGTVSVIDTLNDRIIDTISIEHGSRPVDLAISPDGNDLYVVCNASQSVSVYNARTSSHIKEIKVGLSPEHIAMSSDGRVAYISCKLSDEITVIDANAKEAISALKVSSKPMQMVVQPGKESLYVVHGASPNIVVVENRAVVKRISLGFQAKGVNFDLDGNRLFLLDPGGGRVVFFDQALESMLKFVRVKNPLNVAPDPDGKKLYVTGGSTGNLYIIDKIVGKVLSTSRIGDNVFDLVIMR
ncbi:MAG: YncE family protein [Acidobacteriota bacterium]